MKVINLFLFFSILLAVVLTLSAANKEKKPAMVSYSDIGTETIIVGSLGKPLGVIFTVQGQFLGQAKIMNKADEGKLLFEVSMVNGKKISQSVIIGLQIFRWSNVAQPVPGKHYTYIGYETGSMSGIPDDAFKYIPLRVATAGYYFATYFQILTVVE
jgi:hypothetical protein